MDSAVAGRRMRLPRRSLRRAVGSGYRRGRGALRGDESDRTRTRVGRHSLDHRRRQLPRSQLLRQGRVPHHVDHLRHDSVTVRRQAARVILIDEAGRVLLFRGGDPHRPDAGTWWFTPGGGLDDGETIEDAAQREVREETGYVVTDLGAVVLERSIEFEVE